MEDVIGNYGGRLLVAIVGVGIALAGLVVVLRFIRNRGPLPFLRGNSGRQARLQVLDSTAVDTRRRLVLVRRDNVEHLIMIGGPTDVVIESRIVAEGDADYDDSADAFPATSFYDDGDTEEDDGFDEASARFATTPPWRDEPTRAAMSPADTWRSNAESRYNSEEAPVAPRPVATPAGAPNAASLPETARRAPPTPTSPTAPVATRPVAPAPRPTPKAAAISEQMNDFERMLEAEMASRLEAGRANQPRPANQQPTAARPSATQQAPRPAGGPPAPANPDQRVMQEQMARIFGGDNS